MWHAASRLRKRRSVDALTGTSHRRDRRVETSVSIPSSRAAAAGRGYRRRRPRVGASMTARYSPRSALAERFTCSPRPRRRSQCARERYADDSPSACQTARAATPDLRRDDAKTTKHPGRGVTHDLARCAADLCLLRYHPTILPRPSPLVLSQARHWAAAGPVLGPPPVHLKARSRSTKRARRLYRERPQSIAPSSSSPSAQRTRRGHAGEPVRVPLPPLWPRP